MGNGSPQDTIVFKEEKFLSKCLSLEMRARVEGTVTKQETLFY